ncbi:MAG: glycosyltransferase [Ginsengibacter sp.]
MEYKISNQGVRFLRVLVAPLDWGLGHATRCIPIIKELIRLDCTVLIAGDGPIIDLLKKEFPSSVFLRCKGYKITYSRNKRWMMLKIFFQLPRILSAICREHYWLKKVINDHSIDAIISDNRLGMFAPKIPSIYITHQLFIRTGNPFTEKIAQKIHYYFIKKYKACWVPDNENTGLAGMLSHPEKRPGNILFIGPLSRLNSAQLCDPVYDVLILLSGPEPQRTIFENQILAQLETFPGRALFARGLPFEKKHVEVDNQSVKVLNHVSAEELNIVMAQSKLVIARCGYTTIMDLAALRKTAILVPTPGQTEQEYLAEYLMEKKYFLAVPQEEFSLTEFLKKNADFKYVPIDISFNEYKKTISQFVLSLKKPNFASQ